MLEPDLACRFLVKPPCKLGGLGDEVDNKREPVAV